MTLPLRLRDRAHEPAHGALLRLCARSGRVAVSSFASTLGSPLREVLAGRHVPRVAELAGIAGTPLAWWSPAIATTDRVVAIAGEEISLGDWSIATRRHCPECLSGDVRDAAAASVPPEWLASHRSWWDVRSIAACPEHGVALVDACPSCRAPLGWRDARRLGCPRCGCDLLAGAMALDDPLGRYVAARLGIGRAERPALLEALPLRQAVRICAKLGRAGLDAGPAPTTAGVPAPEVGAEGFRRALRGDRGLDDVLDRALARRGRDAADGLGGTYGWIHDAWLGIDDPAVGPFRETLRRHAVANGVMARDEERLDWTPPPTMSLTRAAAEAGVAFSRMRSLLDDAGAIPAGSRRGVAFTLDPDVVREAAPKPRCALRRAARAVLGVGRTALAGLAEAGRLDLTDENALRASADRLMAAVARQLCGGAAPTGAAPLTTAAVAASVPLARLLDALLHGCLPAWRAEAGVGLAGVLVRPVDLASLRGRADGFTGVTAARSLALHQQCVLALIRDGVLRRGPDGLIAPATMDRFRAEYVSGGDLARQHGCSPRKLIASLAEKGVRPAWPLATHRQAVFRRSEVLRRGGMTRG